MVDQTKCLVLGQDVTSEAESKQDNEELVAKVEDKEELDENAAERQDSSHDNAGNGLGVDALVWDLPWYLVSANGMFQSSFSESEEGSDKGQWNRDTEPEC